MATYVNDLRLKEITTGDESGTWGTSTNTNLELIADAFSYATKDCFASDADATETMADGVADEIRSLYLKVTSSATLTATRTLTLAPNTVSKTWIIENATTGSQSISISQGSGANVTIPNGDTKIIYTDGAGAGAAVTDAFANLNVGDLTATNIAGTLTTAAQPNITCVGTLTGFTSTGIDDNATSTAITIDSSENVGINTAAPATLLHIKADSNSETDYPLTIENAADTLDLGIGAYGLSNKVGTSQASDFTMTIGDDLYLACDTVRLPDGADLIVQENDSTTSAIRLVSDADEGFLQVYRAGVQKVQIRGNGDNYIIDNNFGIGTSSPSAKLHVATSGAEGINIGLQNSERYWNMETDGGLLQIKDVSAGSLARMTFDTSGNVGIGTTSPAVELHVYSADQNALKIQTNTAINQIDLSNSTNSPTYITASSYALELKADDNGWGGTASAIKFNVKASEAMRIDSAGNVLINTTTLQGVGGLSLQVGGNNVVIENNTTSSAGNGTEYQVFRRNSTQIGSITMNGTTAVQYNTSSDYRLKENVVTEWDATTRLKQLKPSRFNFITEPDRTVDGFLAHEVQDIVPEAIAGEKDAVDAEGNAKYQGIDQSKLVPLLVKTIQELEARITTLES
jgi:hypothetical protein